ncbi:MAG: hypothetical protein AAGA48_13560 [Myxococcota bacterium]
MVNALGYSTNSFEPRHPGRLCRGRERWIEPWEPVQGDDEPKIDGLRRVVLSGAQFSDDSASDARRGLSFSGVDLASIITNLFPRKTLLAFMEDGHPADIPADAIGIELYQGYRAGGQQQLGLVRWAKRVSTVGEIRGILGDAPPDERVRGFALVNEETDDDVLMERLFLLSGFATLDSPPARYQPVAIPSALELTPALVLVHRDKHGPALGIYTALDLPKMPERLERLCDRAGCLLVPFAIPPMLARWDRALAELRAEWMKTHEDDFPVPPAPESSRPDRRRGRRDRRKPEVAVKPAEE